MAAQAVPLFDVENDLVVRTQLKGTANPRLILKRSPEMEALVLREVDTLVDDWQRQEHAYDGLIYVIFTLSDNRVRPLYIGKAESLGRGRGNLSANLIGLQRDKGKFARWGDNYAYHIGDLSAAVLPGHDPSKVVEKYRSWARKLFLTSPTDQPTLRQPVWFWAKAWKSSDVGIWADFGPTRLSFLEYLLIGVASAAFTDDLLNREGQNRSVVVDQFR